MSQQKMWAHARSLGAADVEIHDAILIAAALCIYNRYEDGLDTWQPCDSVIYAQIGQHLAEHGYIKSSR
jgi:hypothetical protein